MGKKKEENLEVQKKQEKKVVKEVKPTYKYLVGLRVMCEDFESDEDRLIICDSRDECLKFIIKHVDENAKVNEKHGISHELDSMTKYADSDMYDCVVKWTKVDEKTDWLSRLKKRLTGKAQTVETHWFWTYGIYPIRYSK